MSEQPKPGVPIFLDFDGVLLDVSERYFRVHRALINPCPGAGLDRALYWNMKRQGRPIRHILEADGAGEVDEATYRKRWVEMIEAREFLVHDVLIPGTREIVASLAHRHPLVLVTLRQEPDHLAMQLDELKLRPFFEAVLVASPVSGVASAVKAGLLRESGWLRPGALIVGDTEVDIRAGKAAGIKTVAVLSGIRDRAALEAEAPDAIVDDIHKLADVLYRL
jgi:phosphoglycolate phosphatase-like HAD superfamily hydrolase